MNTFRVQVQGIEEHWSADNIVSLVGSDASGRFGIQAGHEFFITCLQPGLIRLCDDNGHWFYLAQPGAVLVFEHGQLNIACTEFMRGADADQLLNQLEKNWLQQDEDLHAAKSSITQVEQTLARKLWQMNRQEGL